MHVIQALTAIRKDQINIQVPKPEPISPANVAISCPGGADEGARSVIAGLAPNAATAALRPCSVTHQQRRLAYPWSPSNAWSTTASLNQHLHQDCSILVVHATSFQCAHSTAEKSIMRHRKKRTASFRVCGVIALVSSRRSEAEESAWLLRVCLIHNVHLNNTSMDAARTCVCRIR